jgi:hypothetical protein
MNSSGGDSKRGGERRSRESDGVLVSNPRWHQVFSNPGKGGPSSDEGEMWQWKKENA